MEVADKPVIGLPFKECFVCGKTPSTRHHAIPKTFKPLRNVTLPLCAEHKDITHHIIKQCYFPRHLRQKIGKIIKRAKEIDAMANSIKKELNFTNNPHLSYKKDKSKGSLEQDCLNYSIEQ